MKTFTISEGKAGFEIFGRVEIMGPDVLVILWGGAAHIGAIGMAAPRPSLRDPGAISATSSVFTFSGHKEDDLAKSMSESLSARLNKKTVVVAGIHWDNAGSDDIAAIMAACDALKERIIEMLSASP
jgi:hypothetical protein